MREIHLITFDADQTLSDFWAVLRIALKETAAHLSERLGREIAAQSLQDARNEVASRPENQTAPMIHLRRLGIEAIVGDTPRKEELVEDALTLFRKIRFEQIKHMPFAPDLIRGLVGKTRLGWITNGNSRPIHNGYRDEFDITILAEDVGVAKPDPGIFEIALARAGGIAPEYWLHVGDDPITDVQGARDAGGRTVWFDQGDFPGASVGADHRIAHLSDLPAILETYRLVRS